MMMEKRAKRFANFVLLAGVLTLFLFCYRLLRAESVKSERIAIRNVTKQGSIFSLEGTVLWESSGPGKSGNCPTERIAKSYGFLIGRTENEGIRSHMDSYLWKENGKYKHGDDVYLTVSNDLQEFAYWEILKGEEGSVIVLDNETGEIRCLASRSDTVQPLNLNDTTPFVEEVESKQGGDDYYTRGIYETDPPGSVFKIVTAITALEQRYSRKLKDEDFTYNDSEVFWLDDNGDFLENNNGNKYPYDLDLEEAFRNSVNTYFANLGLKVGWDKMEAMANKLKFGVNFEIPHYAMIKSSFGKNDGSKALLARTSIGQGALAVTPMNLALLGSVVANDGYAKEPSLIKIVKMPNDKIEINNKKSKNKYIVKSAYSRKTSEDLKDVLHATAEAYGFTEDYGVVYAKTGTAELSADSPYHHTYVLVATSKYSFVLSRNKGDYSRVLLEDARRLAAYLNELYLTPAFTNE